MNRRLFFRSLTKCAAAVLGVAVAPHAAQADLRPGVIHRWIGHRVRIRRWVPWGNGGYILFDRPRVTGRRPDGTWWVNHPFGGAWFIAQQTTVQWGAEPDGSILLDGVTMYIGPTPDDIREIGDS